MSLVGTLGKVFNVQVRFGADTTGFMGKMAQMGAAVTNVGRTMTMGLTLPIVAIGVTAVTMAAKFEQSMNKVEAVTQGTAEEMKLLSDVAKELGRTTMFSASQAADGMTFLAMAGFEVNEIAEAMPAVLNLAAAANMDLATAADISSNIMTGYGMEVSELSGAMDVMAGAFTGANTDLQQLGEAMAYVGPIAAGLEIPFEQTAAVLGMFGNAGIQASRAGTALRMGLLRLVDPPGDAAAALNELGLSTIDADGNFRDLTQIMIDMATAMDERAYTETEKLATSMQIFGLRAGAPFASVLSQGTDELLKFVDALEDTQGLAKDIADTQMEGLNGQITKLKSAFEGLMIAIGESGILGSLTKLAEKATGFISELAKADPQIIQYGVNIALIVAAIGPLLMMLGTIMTIAPAVGAAITFMFGPWGLLIAAIVGGIILLIKNWDKIQPALQPVIDFFLRVWNEVVVWFQEQIPMLTEVWDSVVKYFGALWDRFGPAITLAFQGTWIAIKTAVLLIWEGIKFAWDVFWTTLKGILDVATALLQGDWEGAWEAIKETVIGIWDAIKEFIGGSLTAIWEGMTKWFGKVTDGWEGLKNALVGQSIIPDMLSAIETEWDTTLERIEGRTERFVQNIMDEMDKLRFSTFMEMLSGEREWTDGAIKGDGGFQPKEDKGPDEDEDEGEGEIVDKAKKLSDEIGDALLGGINGLIRAVASGKIGQAIAKLFTQLGNVIAQQVSKMVTASIGGGGMWGSIVGAAAGGAVGFGIGLLSNLIGGGPKMPGRDLSNLNYTYITNWEDFFKFGFTLPSSFVMSGRSDELGVDPHGRVLDYAFGDWEDGGHFTP